MALNEDTTLYNKAFEKIYNNHVPPCALRTIDNEWAKSKATGKCF
jgi:hypothetical protein